MNGTLLCAVDDSEGGRRALELSLELAERLGLRLVAAHIAEVHVRFGSMGIDDEDLTWRDRIGAERRLERILRAFGVQDSVERRVAVGDVAGRIAQFAAEDAAKLIVVGAERKGRKRRRIANSIADQLASETPVPVLVALPRADATHERIAAAARG
jgi:nucleotide-binding universal stress UspA family protein